MHVADLGLRDVLTRCAEVDVAGRHGGTITPNARAGILVSDGSQMPRACLRARRPVPQRDVRLRATRWFARLSSVSSVASAVASSVTMGLVIGACHHGTVAGDAGVEDRACVARLGNGAISQWVSYDASGRLTYKPLSDQGDRIMDYS